MSLLEATDFIMQKKILSAHEHYDFTDLRQQTGQSRRQPRPGTAQNPIKDTHSSELMHMQGKVFSLRHEFTFHGSGGEELGTIKKKIAKLVGEEFWVEKNGQEFMRIYGNFTEHEYQFEVAGQAVASVHKKWVTLRNQLGVSITGQADHRIIIGAVIVIEHIEVTEKQSNSGPFNTRILASIFFFLCKITLAVFHFMFVLCLNIRAASRAAAWQNRFVIRAFCQEKKKSTKTVFLLPSTLPLGTALLI